MSEADEKPKPKAKPNYSRPWLHASRMRTSERKDGLVERWVSKSRFLKEKDAPGGLGEWQVDEKRHPELRRRIDDGARIGSVTELGGEEGNILCVAPKEWLDERTEFYAKQCKSRRKVADKELASEVKTASGGAAAVYDAEYGEKKS